MAEIIKTKHCSSCKQIKTISAFSKNKTHKDGYQNECKKCRSNSRKVFYRQKQIQKGFTVHNIRKPNRISAKNAINNAIFRGKLPKVQTQKCAYCSNRAEEYHHHLGYKSEHHFDVIPVCKKHHNQLHKVS